MKLLYTITAYPPSTGGAQIHQHLLAQTLSKNHEALVISHWSTNRTDWLLGTTCLAPNQSADYIIDGIKVHQLGLSLLEKAKLVLPVLLYYPAMPYSVSKIAKCLKHHLNQHATDIDLIHNVRIGREGLSYASYQLARERGVPFVLTPVHHPRWVGWRYKVFTELYQKADAVIALTNTEKQTLVGLGVASDKIHITGIGPVLAPTANPRRFLDKYQIDGPIVLFLGQHYSYKGYLQVLEASKLVWQKLPETHFVFIGPSVKNSERIFQTINDPRIHRLGKVDLQEKTDGLAACSLLCVPSTQESFGGVYTEAWSFQKPVIGCDIPAVSEVISEGVDGFLVKQDPYDIAQRIIFLLDNPSIAQKLGDTGYKKVQDRYTWSSIAQLTEDAYRKIV